MLNVFNHSYVLILFSPNLTFHIYEGFLTLQHFKYTSKVLLFKLVDGKQAWFAYNICIWITPVITLFISGLKSRVLKLSFLSLKMMVKSGLEFILKLTEPLQSCCCPVQKYLPRMAELAWQLSRYLWRGSVSFKINSRPLFTIIFKLKIDNFKTRDFSPLIERVLAGVTWRPLIGQFLVVECILKLFYLWRKINHIKFQEFD